VAYEVAKRLHAPLDVFVVRKLGVPGHEELAMGAIASGGAAVLDQEVIDRLGLSPTVIEGVRRREEQELARRERLYRDHRRPHDVDNQSVILIDDGLATGSSMRAAVQALRSQRPKRIVVAVPIASPETCAEFKDEVDETICAVTPKFFYAVGQWYEDFTQTSDGEVRELLAKAQEFTRVRT
jgi:putative phosphoribosyl transferase